MKELCEGRSVVVRGFNYPLDADYGVVSHQLFHLTVQAMGKDSGPLTDKPLLYLTCSSTS